MSPTCLHLSTDRTVLCVRYRVGVRLEDMMSKQTDCHNTRVGIAHADPRTLRNHNGTLVASTCNMQDIHYLRTTDENRLKNALLLLYYLYNYRCSSISRAA